jgi:hypothetical protein
MKRLYILVLTLLTLTLSAYAQFDTTSTLYDFESLPNGNLNGQDNWQTTLFNTSVDWRIADTLFANVGKGIFFNQVGPSVGASASRVFDSIFPNATFDPTVSVYILQFDIVRNYWGVDVGLSADLNNDGKTAKTDVLEKALTFRSSSQSGESLTVPNGTVYTLGNNLTNNAWFTIRITIRPFIGNFGGTVDIEYQPVFASAWSSLANGLPLYTDSLSTTKTNITRWNTVFMHSEGATGKLDELRFTKISPQQTTGIGGVFAEDIQVHYSQGYFHISGLGKVQLAGIEIFDTAGKRIGARSCGDCSAIPAGHLTSGTYLIRVLLKNQGIYEKRLFVPSFN